MEQQNLVDNAVIARYDAAIARGELSPDAAQRRVAERLGELVSAFDPKAVRPTLLSRFVKRRPVAARGVYLWGGVGRGKSMMMDLLYDVIPIREKRRVHFHEFMQDIDRKSTRLNSSH